MKGTVQRCKNGENTSRQNKLIYSIYTPSLLVSGVGTGAPGGLGDGRSTIDNGGCSCSKMAYMASLCDGG